MSKLSNYTGNIVLISGITQKNGGDFPLVEANAVQVDESGKRLDEKLEELENDISGIGNAANIKLGHALVRDANNRISVDVANDAEEDNTRPITSAAVYTEIGNINILLQTI